MQEHRPPATTPRIESHVVRRTLTIFGVFFGGGVLLSIFWMSKEVMRVHRIQKVQPGEAPPRTSPATPPAERLPIPPSVDGGAKRGADTNGMVWIPGGSFRRGAEGGASDELPVREITVSGFWIDRTEVTNEAFEKFVRATGYVTVAERKPDPAEYPGVPPERLVAGAAVFRSPNTRVELSDFLSWWEYIPGASWKHPEGPTSDLTGRERHPVVHVCWTDAVRFAEWAGKRLPTEAEWEFAARGGLQGKELAWEGGMTPGGRWQANIWQGDFPYTNTREDGHVGTAAVGSFPPNGYGLFDMAGNVWEWCADYYLPNYYEICPQKDPPGPDTSFDPNEPGVVKRVQRGGSYLCSDTYCTGYRPGARMKSTPDTGLSHSGFRCARSGPAPTALAR